MSFWSAIFRLESVTSGRYDSSSHPYCLFRCTSIRIQSPWKEIAKIESYIRTQWLHLFTLIPEVSILFLGKKESVERIRFLLRTIWTYFLKNIVQYIFNWQLHTLFSLCPSVNGNFCYHLGSLKEAYSFYNCYYHSCYPLVINSLGFIIISEDRPVNWWHL